MPWPRCRKDTGFNDKDLKAAIQELRGGRKSARAPEDRTRA
jgi:hypothetical protein